ncbi:MAG: hypothetical protein Q4D06_05870, partial [Coriobacteriia bacterium]|nr:hypothetical protein [Coriobacteriia bacterium]
MSNSPEAPVTRQHVASFTHPSSFREFLSTYGPRFALCLLGVVTLRLWIQCDLYDRYSSTDFGAITVMGTFVRVAAMLLIIMIGGRAGLSTRAQRVMDVLSCVLMTMASALYLLQYSFPGAPLSLPASLLASLGIAWAGVMWIRVFVRMEPGEAFLYSFVCIALSAVLGFVLGLMDGSMAYAFCIFLPLCSYLTCVQAHKTLDALDGPRDESRPDRHAATLVGEQGEGAVRMRDFVLPLAGLALLNLALGLSRGFPDGSSISLPVEMQLVHQLGTALLALSYVWMVLVLGRRLTRVLFWGVPAAVMALGVVLVVTGTPDVIPLGGAFITISNSLFIGVLWYTAYELSRHSDVVPYAVFGVVWIAHLLPREAGRLMVFGLGPAVAATDSEVFLVLTITLLLAAGIALLLSDAGMGGVVLFPELRQRAAKPASAAAADPATAAPAPELATA